jgi:hypothetical protein
MRILLKGQNGLDKKNQEMWKRQFISSGSFYVYGTSDGFRTGYRFMADRIYHRFFAGQTGSGG